MLRLSGFELYSPSGRPCEIFMVDLMYLRVEQFAKISQLCSPYLKYHLDLTLFFSLNK